MAKRLGDFLVRREAKERSIIWRVGDAVNFKKNPKGPLFHGHIYSIENNGADPWFYRIKYEVHSGGYAFWWLPEEDFIPSPKFEKGDIVRFSRRGRNEEWLGVIQGLVSSGAERKNRYRICVEGHCSEPCTFTANEEEIWLND